MTEIAIIGSDMQEVIGTAIALYLLSNKWYVDVFSIFNFFKLVQSIYQYLQLLQDFLAAWNVNHHFRYS